MRKMFLFTVVLSLAFALEAFAQVNFSFNGIGGYGSYVKPEDPIESTFGFGVRADLGTIFNENVTMGALLDYWAKEYDELGSNTTFSEVTIAPYLQYNFASGGNIVPYAGGGFGLAFNSVEVTVNYLGYTSSASSSDNDFVIFGMGGAKMQLSEKMTGFAEARYQIGDVDVFFVSFGVIYMLGK